MITFHEAIDIFRGISHKLAKENVALENAYNRVLAEDVFSDVNMPPFNKSAVDGYACRKEDLQEKLLVVDTVHAGSFTDRRIKAGECIKIMTGAPVPKGADTVIMIEHTELLDNSYIRFTKEKTKSNICLLGEDVIKGDLLLKKGTLLLAHHIAVLASAGYIEVCVAKFPKVAILSTGSELIEPGSKPQAAQIRNSNAYNLIAQLKQMQIEAHYAGIIDDNKGKISEVITSLLAVHDLLILTGGASVGEHDFVPGVLNELGLKLQFDRIAIQPGKPVSFGAGKDTFSFGLSGNPVSSYLQFEILVKPFIYSLMGCQYTHPIQLAPLAHAIDRKKADRLKFFPVQINAAGMAEEIKFNGSAHIAGLSEADGFGLFPKDCHSLASEELIEVLRIR